MLGKFKHTVSGHFINIVENYLTSPWTTCGMWTRPRIMESRVLYLMGKKISRLLRKLS